MEIVELVGAILNHVSPAEERVFLRVWLRTYAVGQASCRATFEDLARDAALSWTTTKTALLKLEGRGLLDIARHHEAPCTLTPQFLAIGGYAPPLELGTSRTLGLLTDTDREDFVALKRALSPAKILHYKELARQDGTELDEELLFGEFWVGAAEIVPPVFPTPPLRRRGPSPRPGSPRTEDDADVKEADMHRTAGYGQARTRRRGLGSVVGAFVVLALWGAVGAARAAEATSYEALHQWLEEYRETEPAFEPGQTLTLKDRDALEPFLPQSVWPYYFFDDMAMEITEPGQYPFPPGWGQQVPGDYHLDGAGVLVNFKGGGFPFPAIRPEDPQAAVKVIWNMMWEPGTNDHSMEMQTWSRSEHGKLDRRFEFVSTQAEYGLGEESLVPGYEEVRSKMSMEFISPRDLAGAKQLTIIYLDHYKENSGWMYSPVQRKPRRLLASERTSEMMGMDFTMEDMMGFGGKVHEQEWTYLGRKQILATMNLKTNPPAGGPHLWVPHQVRWELRDAHVVLIDPKKDSHPYSHKVVFVDAETYVTHWMVAFDRQDNQLLRLQQHFRKYTEDYTEEPATQAPHMKMDLSHNHGHRVFLHLGETDINVKKPHATFMHCYAVKEKYSPGRAKQVFSLRNMATGRR